MATYYISSSGGNDANNGLTPATAWKTHQPVNTLIAANGVFAGDAFGFKYGDTFPGAFLTGGSSNWSSSGSIKVFAYGQGNKPIFDSYKYVNANAWVLYDSPNNIWRVDLTDTTKYTGNIYNNSKYNGANTGCCKVNGKFLGKKRSTIALLQSSTQQWDWCDDADHSRYMYVKSFGNPGTLGGVIAVSIEGIPTLNIAGYVDYYDIDCLGHGGVTANFGGCTNVNFYNCAIREYGGSTLASYPSDPTIQYGTGIQAYGSATNCSIEGCYFEEGFETAMTLQSPTGNFINCQFKNNRVNRCPQALEIWIQGSGAFINCKFQYNTCENIGYDQRHYTHVNAPPGGTPYFDQYLGVFILMYGNQANMKDFEISHNSFFKAKDGYNYWSLSGSYTPNDVRLPNSHDNDIFLYSEQRLNSNISSGSNQGSNQLVEDYATFSSLFGLETGSRWYIMPNTINDLNDLTDYMIAIQGQLQASKYADNHGVRTSLSRAAKATLTGNYAIRDIASNNLIQPVVSLSTLTNGFNDAKSTMVIYRGDGSVAIPNQPISGDNFNGHLQVFADSSTVIQMASKFDGTIYFRTYWFGAWKAWQNFTISNSATASTIVKRTSNGGIANPRILLTALTNNFNDAFSPNVIYTGDGTVTTLIGQPFASFNGVMQFFGQSDGTQAGSFGYQHAVKYDGSAIYERTLWGNTWNTWRQLFP